MNDPNKSLKKHAHKRIFTQELEGRIYMSHLSGIGIIVVIGGVLMS